MIRVIKVGGSLLDWPLLPRALSEWIASQPPAVNVLVAGGGPIVDEIRRADRDFQLGDEAAHWLAIDALAVTTRLVAAILRDVSLVRNYDELLALVKRPPQTVVFEPGGFLREVEPTLPGCALPRDWSVTSDAIAARLAEAIKADELVLLKSAPPPAAALPSLAAAGYIDPHLGKQSGLQPRLRLVNLRAVGGGAR
jgi:aspartokinase-like uncharacterized kinase